MHNSRNRSHQSFGGRQRFHNRAKRQIKSLPGHELMRAIRDVQLIRETRQQEDVVVESAVHTDFSNFGLAAQLQQNITEKKYTAPTPIQDKAIGAIMAGRDLIGIANTGTGKTAAFLIPLVDKIFKNRFEKVLVIAPTRELALQIQEELRGFTKGMNVRSVLCIGGMSLSRQKADLRQNAQFVIGTPGRIKDLIRERSLDPSQFHTVVLDEADRMVDIGFINEIKYFISLLPRDRQSLFFSATISGKVREILQNFVHNPVTVSVKQQDTAENIQQDVIKVGNKAEKLEKLQGLLRQDGFDKVLIFGRTKWGVQRLSNDLAHRGFKVGAIHGNKNQNQRQRVLEAFKRNEITVLLATDVASRGLDINDVSHVINYDMPASYEDYVHRIGRTGRASKKGTALTFVEQ